MSHSKDIYYIPHGTKWPIVGSIGMFLLMVGASNWLNGSSSGQYMLYAGLLILIFMMFGWFGLVIRESQLGMYNAQVGVSFRMGMVWFIFSEVMFFAVFFGTLLYTRMLVMPWLGGEGVGVATGQYLWAGFEAVWPNNGPANLGGDFDIIPAFDVPLLNTLILLTSGFTLTMAHWALKKSNQRGMVMWMVFTVLLGIAFLYYQVEEYMYAYQELGLTMGSGIYGSTFFMLTGFHGFHVTLGTIMLIVIAVRCARGHFTKENHFAFEGVAWYWHFVDVVWLALFVFVYVV
ncbi:MAG: cytochrome c oxidase subunit 3 [Xanthomonadales bacterium]|nr:cytochrome c oxidase subunit 3 [Xanthomonadales bacterium]